jgi:hypothetical protein
MVNAPRVTLCTGLAPLESIDAFVEPILNVPAGMLTITIFIPVATEMVSVLRLESIPVLVFFEHPVTRITMAAIPINNAVQITEAFFVFGSPS